MIIYPAIDIKDGRCVRLIQGDYNKETVYSTNPVDIAKEWQSKGAEFIHLIDLNGAAQGYPVNIKVIEKIVNNIVNIKVQVGGGIRTNETVEQLLNIGVSRVIIGTKAVKSPEWVQELCVNFPGKIAVSIDIRNGNIATEGWLQAEELSGINFAEQLQDYNPCSIIVTDINKDGMLEGPNLELMEEFKDKIDTPIIASGGITSILDLESLSKLKIDGAIIGKALYENKIDLAEAIRHCS